MKVIIRTVENGEILSHEEVQNRRLSVKSKIIEMGFQYIETESILGSLDAMGHRIEEKVYVIEDVTGENYV